MTVLFGTKRASADHVIERAAYQASQRGEGADVVVATDDRLERDVVGGMGVATMGARALEAEVARVAGGVDTETKRMRDDSRRTHEGGGRARSRGAAAARAHPPRRGRLRLPRRRRRYASGDARAATSLEDGRACMRRWRFATRRVRRMGRPVAADSP